MGIVRIPFAVLHEHIVGIFTRLGVPEEDAAQIADVLIKAEQWGIASHGVFRVKRYAECILAGGIRPDAGLRTERQQGAWALCSADGGLGIPASCKAAAIAVSLARQHTVGVVNVRMSHHNGAEGIYADRIAREGMVGIAMSTGNPIMAPTGSIDRLIGNNPFAWAVPGGKHGTVMLDVAMSAAADGKIQLAKARGEAMPEGCFLDRDGVPSTNPDDYLDGGALLPFGKHKGYGLAVMVECLAGILSQAALTWDINSWNETRGKSGNTGHMFVAMDIGKIMRLDGFVSQVEELARRLKSGRTAPGAGEVFLPGEQEHRRSKELDGIVELAPSTFDTVLTTSGMVGAPTDKIAAYGGGLA